MRKMTSAIAAVILMLLVVAPAQAQQGRRNISPEERARREAEAARQLEEEMNTPRSIEALNSVWIEELTWMEVRDAIREGKTTAIIPTGGMEQNGPYLAIGKHNYVLQGACERIARKLGNALCAPIIKLVPEGNIDEPSGHMRYPGTISLRQETFEAVLADVGASLRAHGFEHIIYIGDSGGNQRGMAAVAAALNERWGEPIAHHIPVYYDKAAVVRWMEEALGIVQPTDDGIHDNYIITSEIMLTDPTMVRYEQRVASGLATINGLSIEPMEDTIAMGEKLLGYRVDRTVGAIRAAIAAATTPEQ
ncbi:MAG: creatininase family protein [Gemmatimonadetes bacterium]|nr:creatininase family protein [Gemmatimonadota bacterium]